MLFSANYKRAGKSLRKQGNALAIVLRGFRLRQARLKAGLETKSKPALGTADVRHSGEAEGVDLDLKTKNTFHLQSPISLVPCNEQ